MTSTPRSPVWRPAAPADDSAIIELVARLYTEDPSDEPVPLENARRTIDALRMDPIRGRVVVLDMAGVIAGYAFLISFWSNELGGETCEIDELYVASEERNRGFGSRLVASLRDGSGPWPRVPVALCLQVSPTNERARKLYERLGFALWKNALMVAR